MGNTFNYQTQRLVTLAQNGDQTALDRLCKVYNEQVLRIIRMRMGPDLRTQMQSMDLVQDAFISALRSLENFTYKNEGDFLRWIAKIAENRIRDNARKIHAKKRDGRKGIPLNNNSSTPSLIMSKREDLDRLEKAMEKLKPEYREVITLTKIEGLTYKEAAEKMGRAPDAVRMLLSRAITSLGQSFEKI